MKQLPPLGVRDGYWKGIEREIDKALREWLYAPLLRVMEEPHPEYRNAAGSALLAAVQDGTVWYEDGHFRGHFNARISADIRALGGLYHTRSKSWSLPPEDVPADIRVAQARADARYDALRRGFIKTLDNLNIDSIDALQKIRAKYKGAIEWMDGDFQKAVKAIAIPPQLSPAQRDELADEWGQNLDLYIKNWAAENIIKLRQQVQGAAFDGARPESLISLIQQNYGVSKRKAEFLARQETSLLLSKFHETRYAQIGVKRYKWSTSHDERVRSDHKHLNGNIYSFDSPPVTCLRTGARNNPGEDFGCRCVAIGIVE